jgi:hypothetical protein
MFEVQDQPAGLSRKRDGLERLAAVADFELFRPELERAVPRAHRSKGGRMPFDHVLMFKVLILQTQNNLSDERTESYLRDRLTWMRFLGLGLGDPVPDANTIWTFREALTKAGAIEPLFTRFDHVRANGRCEHRCHVQAAQHSRREPNDQRGPGAGGLAGQAGQAQPEGSRCALDREDDQSEAARGRDTAGLPIAVTG